MIDYDHNPTDTDYWNGIDHPLRLNGEQQVSINNVFFSAQDLRAFALYIIDNNAEKTHADMVREGWSERDAAHLMRNAMRVAREIWIDGR